jgi:ADP-ribose pyrophosphatase
MPAAPTPETPSEVEIIERTTPFQGYFRIDRYHLRHRKFDGGWTEAMTRDVFERGHAAAVLLYDPARDAVVLIEQFRVGAHAAGLQPWLIESVAGIIEPGENAEAVVRREAVEESGCEVAELIPIGTYLMTPGGSSETIAFFCARVDSRGAGGIHGLDHEHEDIRVLVLALDEALAQLAAGRIVNANAVIPLQWLALNRERVRAEWSSEAAG